MTIPTRTTHLFLFLSFTTLYLFLTSIHSIITPLSPDPHNHDKIVTKLLAPRAKSVFGRCHVEFEIQHWLNQSQEHNINGVVADILMIELKNGAGDVIHSTKNVNNSAADSKGPRWHETSGGDLSIKTPLLPCHEQLWLYDSISWGYQLIFIWQYESKDDILCEEHVDMAFGRNKGNGPPSKTKWSDDEDGSGNKRAVCSRTEWEIDGEMSGTRRGPVRKRRTICDFDCAKDMVQE